jgi:hypothetical protein
MTPKMFAPLAVVALAGGFGSGYGAMSLADPRPAVIQPHPVVTVRLREPGPSTTITVTPGGADIPGVVTPYSSPAYKPHRTAEATPEATRSPEPARVTPSPSPSPSVAPSVTQSPSPVSSSLPSFTPSAGVLG